jgi:hypothetical protein
MNDDELLARMRKPYDRVHMATPLDKVVEHGRALRRGRRLRGLTGVGVLAGGIGVAAALLVPGTARPAQPGKATLAAWTVAKDPDGGVTITLNQMKNLAGMQATLRADGIPARVTFNSADAVSDPLPRGCTRPDISDTEGANLQAKILQPPALYAYHQRLRAAHPVHYEWIEVPAAPKNGRPTFFTVPSGGGTTHTRDGAHGQYTVRPAGGTMHIREEAHARRIRVGIGGFVAYRLPAWLQKLVNEEMDNPNGSSALYIYPPAIPSGIGLYVGVDVQSANNFSFGEDLVTTSPSCTGS